MEIVLGFLEVRDILRNGMDWLRFSQEVFSL